MKTIGRLPEDQYADCANGYRIHYIDQGEGDVVVFLHGSGPPPARQQSQPAGTVISRATTRS